MMIFDRTFIRTLKKVWCCRDHVSRRYLASLSVEVSLRADGWILVQIVDEGGGLEPALEWRPGWEVHVLQAHPFDRALLEAPRELPIELREFVEKFLRKHHVIDRTGRILLNEEVA